MKTKILLTIVLLASSCFAIITNINSGATHLVMQGAVNGASSGDILLVSTGQYTFMQVMSKSLTIIGGYAVDFSTHLSYDATILDGGGYCAVFSHSTSTVEGLTFTSAGRGISIYHSSIVTARNCKVENNISSSLGAGLRIFGNATLVLEHTVVENNSVTNTSGNGGGAHVSQATLIVSDYSHIRQNYAAEKGGGIYVTSSGKVEVKGNSFVSANTADEAGGGVYLDGGDLLVHDGGDIGYLSGVPNSTPGNGGGIYARNSSVIFKDDFSYLLNSYAGKDGGGAYLTNSTMTFYNNADIGLDSNGGTNCAARNGGGIYAIASTVAITNANIHACRAGLHGGSIFAVDSEVSLYNCEVGNTNDIYTNIAEKDGGAIYNFAGIFFINDSTFLNNLSYDDGGAIYALDTLISNCYFEENKAVNGGGVFLMLNSIVKNCTFENNQALTNGGAIYCDGAGDVYDCVIISNRANRRGGGAYCLLGGTVSDCIISGNSTTSGGGTHCFGGGIVSDCIISGNTASHSGGGAYCLSGGTVSDCIISGNSAGSGGGVRCYGDGGTVSECTISSNSASWLGGGVQCYYGGALTNCLIYNMNTAKFGGGVYCAEGGELYNCTISGNSAADFGGGIFCTNDAAVVDSIIYDNQAVIGNNNWHIDGSNTFFSYCCTVPIAGLPGGNGCITNDPEFVVPGFDYRLQETSACRNSGSNMFWMIDATDLDGNPRIIGGTVDIGCYEYIPEPGKFIYFIIFFLFGKNKINKFVTCLM